MITASVKPTSIGGKTNGSTLSEVLVSLAIMSIGVISLASIFPISVLRSLQATQLTNATNLRYNAEALTNIKPELYTIASPWQPSTAYTVGQIVVATPLIALKQPPAIFQCTYVDSTNPYSGASEPFWRFDGSATIESTGMRWQSYELKNYVIDPLGQLLVDSGRGSGPLYRFGNTGQNSAWVSTTNWPYAFSGFNSTPTISQAEDVATLPDSWIEQAETRSVAYTPGATTCTLNKLQPDLPYFGSANPSGRIVFFDDGGKRSCQRTIAGLSSLPNPAIDPLPSGFVPVRARVETSERRYSWMLAVRRAFSGTTQIDVVVFFRRTFSGEDETVYPATFNAVTDFGSDLGPGINGVQNTLGWPGSDDTQRNWVIIQYNNATGRPFLKKGGFVTDIDNLRWYRITDFFESNTAIGAIDKAQIKLASINPFPSAGPTYVPDSAQYGTNTRYVLIKVDSPIVDSGNQPDATQNPRGGAMLMRGIVDVYPIRARQAWETN